VCAVSGAERKVGGSAEALAPQCPGLNNFRHPADLLRVFSRSSHARVLVLVMLICGTLSAQEYSFRYFGLADGLMNLAVRQIYQDRAGFLWVSTENGIFRYDGERFEAFGPAQGIPATSGAAFGDAPDGSLLAGGDFGLYDLSGNRFEEIPIGAKAVSWAEGIQADGKGHTFIGTDSGLIELSPALRQGGRPPFEIHRFPRVPGASGPAAGGVSVDGEIVWYGCGLELCRKDPKGTMVYGRDSGLPAYVWLVIRKDREGDLWVRGKNGGVFELPRGQPRFRSVGPPFRSSALVGIPALDAGGRMLFPSPSGLLIRGEAGWQKIDRSSALRGTVYAAFEDRQQSLWIGLAGRGLARWRGYREWESYTSESGLGSDLVYEILPMADGSMVVATEAGLFRGTRRGSAISWKKVPDVGDFPVHSVRLAPGGDVWIGTETHGVARIHGGSGPPGKVEWFGEAQGLTGKAAYTLRFDREQRLWAATEAGLFMAKPPYKSFSRVAELPSSRFWAVAEGTGGTMWAGGVDGLFGYVGGHWKNYTRADNLSNREVISLAAGQDGRIWIGYRHGGGIDRIRPLAGGIAIERGVQRSGTDGIVYFLEFDALGRLWAGTERGVDMWDGVRWSHYDSSDGLTWDDCNLNAFASEADGTVWIGTSGGLSRYRPDTHRLGEFSPKVVFTKLVMGRKDVSGERNPSVGIHSNSLTARYSVLNASGANRVIFRYRLIPANDTWTETTQRGLEFAELAPGAFRLEVEARDSDGVWGGAGSGNSAAFSFKIMTPWYRMWWFIGMCVLTPLLLAAVAVRWRMAGAANRERELVRIVEEKTTDLRRANGDLLRLSSLDPLTGLANRRVFDQTLEKECARAQRNLSALSLVIVDVDHFKALNDTEGHQRGDEYLAQVGVELSRLARRQVDVAARYGGEEFALVLPETNAEDAARIGESVRLAIAGRKLPHPASPVAPVLTVSVGVSTMATGRWSSPEQLLAAADGALYRAKRGGRNRVESAWWEGESRETGNSVMIETA
jgi:diguanylate cyclase (GGDEF)-like protein